MLLPRRLLNLVVRQDFAETGAVVLQKTAENLLKRTPWGLVR
jgi:hypothetical protein